MRPSNRTFLYLVGDYVNQSPLSATFKEMELDFLLLPLETLRCFAYSHEIIDVFIPKKYANPREVYKKYLHDRDKNFVFVICKN